MNIDVVATDLGSLPGGGFEEETPIFRSARACWIPRPAVPTVISI